MKDSKFEVGEEVILQSESFPEFNGEYTITDKNYIVRAYLTRISEFAEDTYRYSLAGLKVEESTTWWLESSLRKKHKPSNYSFKELMKETNKELIDG